MIDNINGSARVSEPGPMPGAADIPWPRRCDLFGVSVSATTYDEALERIMDAARRGQPAVFDAMAVHGLIEAVRHPELKRQLNSFAIVAPDGHPVRWALNMLHDGVRLRDRVYGPELMLRACRRAADEGIGVYLYGSRPEVVQRLRDNLARRFPDLIVAGWEPHVFRPLTPEEDGRLVRRINDSGARLVFVGLGCPRQEVFAFEHKDRLHAVQLCVGAAFDFHAGVKPMAPRWMQDRGLEWLFRLWCEPRRLFGRYVSANSLFLVKLAAALVRHRAHSRGPLAMGGRS